MRFSAGCAVALVSLAVGVGCGGGSPPPAPTTPATTPIAVTPPAKVDLSPVPEPTNLVVIGRIAKPDAIIRTVGGWTGLPLPGANELVRSIADDAVASSIDFSQPIDGAVILAGSRGAPKPIWAFSLAVKSVDDAKAKLGSRHRLTATTNGAFKIEGIGQSGAMGGDNGRDDDSDDELDCVLAPAIQPANSGRIVCGSPDELVPYLTRTLPKQSFPTDIHVELRMDPVRGPVNDLRGQLPILARTLMGSQTQAVRDLVDAAIGEMGDYIADTNRLLLDGTIDDKGIKLDVKGEYGSSKSLIAQLATSSVDRAGATPAAFWHLPQETDLAYFSKGTDPKLFTHVREILSNLLVEAFSEGGMPDAEKKTIKELVANRMMPLFTGPAVYGKGFDGAAIDKAIAAKKAVKPDDAAGEDDAERLLVEQLVGWHLLQVGEPIANVGPMLKDWSSLWARPGFQAWAKKHASAKMLSKLRIVPAPAGVTLPKDTVHLEITIPREDIEKGPKPPLAAGKGAKPKTIARKPVVAHILAVPDAGATWLAIGFGDPKLLATKVAASLSSAPDTATLGKVAGYEPLKDAKLNGAMVMTMRGVLVFTADDRDSPYSKLPMLPHKGATPAVMTFLAQGPNGDAKAGSVTGTIRIPRGIIEDGVRLAMSSH